MKGQLARASPVVGRLSAPILVRRERYERELAVALLAGCFCWRRLLSDFL